MVWNNSAVHLSLEKGNWMNECMDFIIKGIDLNLIEYLREWIKFAFKLTYIKRWMNMDNWIYMNNELIERIKYWME